MTLAKICGVTTPDVIQAADEAGAAFIGLVAFERSPRHLSVEAMTALLEEAGRPVPIVVLTVNADDTLLTEIRDRVRPEFIQLHGDETPARAAEVRSLTRAGIIRALPVASAADLVSARAWSRSADHLLFDARPPEGADRPGGLGAVFDWRLMAGLRLSRPWFLAGGMTPANVSDALEITGAPMVDVSSGVESAPGVKDIALIKSFLDQVQTVSPRQ